MRAPEVRSTNEIIVRDTYITGKNQNELKKAENCLLFIGNCTDSLDAIEKCIEDLDHLSLGLTIKNLKASLLLMGYSSQYSTAVALENEFLNDIISSPRPNLEEFISSVKVAIENANEQLKGMRVSLV